MPLLPDSKQSSSAHLAPLDARPLTVLFDVSNKCNLRCRFCYFSYDSVFHRPAVMMTPETFERVASQVLPMARVVYLSAGSESLMNPDFKDLLRICASYQPPMTKLLTNGVLLDRETIDALIEHELTELHVSVDAPNQETYEYLRRGSSWDLLKSNLALLQQRRKDVNSPGPLLQFNVILLRSNLDQLNDFVDLALEWGAERIACRHLMPYQDLGMDEERTDHDPEQANLCFLKFLEYAQAKGVMVTSFPDFYLVDNEPWSMPVQALDQLAEGGEMAQAELDGPLGHWDTPADKLSLVTESVDLEGWALSVLGACTVEISCLIPEQETATNGTGGVPRKTKPHSTLLGRATFLNAVRPDVTSIHRELPAAYRCGWRFRLQALDLPTGVRADATILVHVIGPNGKRRELGQRVIKFSSGSDARPLLFCTKPFEDVYIDPEGNVYPYPDCQTVEPFGSLSKSSDFRSIWFGVQFENLRRQVLDANPPSMCTTCPDFINRNVDDARFFAARDVEPALRRPLGFLDQPGTTIDTDLTVIKLRGWALAYGVMKGIDLYRETETGRVHLCSITPGTEERADVAAAYPRLAKGQQPGWSHDLQLSQFPMNEASNLVVIASTEEGTQHSLGSCAVTPRYEP